MSGITLREFAEEARWICLKAPLEERPARIAPHIAALLGNPHLLDDAARCCPANGYGRNPIHIDADGLFSVIAAVWPRGVATPIHDHKVWCAVGLYEGRLQQRRYRPEGGDGCCAVTEVTDVAPGAAWALPVSGCNIHSMHNRHPETAVSIHVYGGDTHAVGPNLLKIYKV
jgi:predicted metal-dependent enzyme (double-stranded beta helix superfamily)